MKGAAALHGARFFTIPARDCEAVFRLLVRVYEPGRGGKSTRAA
jgi:hypothetical protein